MRSAGLALLFLLSIAVAGYAVVGYSVMPLGALVHPDMQAAFAAHPVGIYSHVFAAAVALLLGPFQFSTRIRRNHIRIHRWTGRAYLLVGVLGGGLSGLYIAQFAFGGPVARLGFATLALCWLYTGARAFQAIRDGAIEEHRKWMVRNFALALAAVTLRIYVPASFLAGVDFAVAYAVIAWVCWLPNLVVAEWLHRSMQDRRPQQA